MKAVDMEASEVIKLVVHIAEMQKHGCICQILNCKVNIAHIYSANSDLDRQIQFD